MWCVGHVPFTPVNRDPFIPSSSEGNMLWTCENTDICTLHPHARLQTPAEQFTFWAVYGPTIGSIDREKRKIHRRLINAAFNLAINPSVWDKKILGRCNGMFLNRYPQWSDKNDTALVPDFHKLDFKRALLLAVMQSGILFMTLKVVLRNAPLKCFGRRTVHSRNERVLVGRERQFVVDK
ncbi:uncharacterized protein BDR25DRAFT_311323 [Lindgomyces ingoldianus]|uniref:Uncharacterized protein n=1 Tax=Lindgomyces ingoldianus TaxID=673940 RepID=A0ACB6R6Z1_9PLEO|nr:uncharacterized protein BDR25DRAFT_311323 [Lindgomyces ingoldianus]KAF2474926.1 hypothetical protein BDR25DRAFT_311323 [Lindgomyces ingoldianus]